MPFNKGVVSGLVALQDLKTKVLRLRCEVLMKHLTAIMEHLSANKPMEQLFMKEGIELNPVLLEFGTFMHPIVWHVNDEGMKI